MFGFFKKKKEQKRLQAKSELKLKNALVNPVKLTIISNDKWEWGGCSKYTSYQHVISLKEDIDEKYQAGSLFKKEIDTVIFPSYREDEKKFSSSESFRVDLTTWERV